jgi:hypothetical protein
MAGIRLEELKTTPHPGGNRVDVYWLNPAPELYKGVRVMGRESTHPVSADDVKAHLVAEILNTLLFTVDPGFAEELDIRDLSSELIAEFAIRQIALSASAAVSVKVKGSKWHISDGDAVYLLVESGGQLEVYGIETVSDTDIKAEQVYYYTLFPFSGDPPMYEFHRANRTAAMATGPYDLAGLMYKMLPVIYHRYDTHLPPEEYIEGMAEEDKEKGQLRRFLDIPGSHLDRLYSFAAAAFHFHNRYRVDGSLLPLLGRWIGWKTDFTREIDKQRNELRDAPALYKTIEIIPTVETTVKRISGWESRTREFVHNVAGSNRPERLNLWLCSRDEIDTDLWHEPDEVFSLDFAYEGRPAAALDEEGTLRLFYHSLRNGRWDIYTKSIDSSGRGTPSEPFTHSKRMDRHPAAALQGDTLRVFWDSYNEEEQTWDILFKNRTGGEWGQAGNLADELPDAASERKSPFAVVDGTDRLWLFWLEKTANHWQLKYNRHNGTNWEADPSVEFPLDGVEDPRVVKDLFVHLQPGGPDQGIRVFWTRKGIDGSGTKGNWEIAYRVKNSLAVIAGGWSSVEVLVKDPPDGNYHDCEPTAITNGDGEIELYWASNREGSWAVWTGMWADVSADDLSGTSVPVTSLFSQRTPLPMLIQNRLYLLYRSNKSIAYQSEVYGATETVDFRYSGTTTMDTRNSGKIHRRGEFDDFQTYTYDCGKNGKPDNSDWYARDTIGVYLEPDTEEVDDILAGISRLRKVLKEFMPITDRPVFITGPLVHAEAIFNGVGGVPGVSDILEFFHDTLVSPVEEELPEPGEEVEEG